MILASTIYDCDFECNCTCQWTHDPTAKFKWIIQRGSTDSSNTGPDADHTTGTRFGYYIYIEASYPATFNDSARLISPDLTVEDGESCFRFYYHMFGSDIYRLNIYGRISKWNERKQFLFYLIIIIVIFSRRISRQSIVAKTRKSSMIQKKMKFAKK